MATLVKFSSSIENHRRFYSPVHENLWRTCFLASLGILLNAFVVRELSLVSFTGQLQHTLCDLLDWSREWSENLVVEDTPVMREQYTREDNRPY